MRPVLVNSEPCLGYYILKVKCYGYISFHVYNSNVYIDYSCLNSRANRWRGRGRFLYDALIKYCQEQSYKWLFSGIHLSKGALHAWARLRNIYTVKLVGSQKTRYRLSLRRRFQ